ncbi:hypothetical protein OG890_21040 [Streptomyces anulatus]|uniref:hypothetical protein n=1 Tax=Streptomyces TaxID=1883 RepID=UPI000241B0DF|nr:MULTISPECIES: hypothetical protein [Streptomyces]EHM24151.1 hypothetical protein SPW_7459 [Streptomyces sp. W007]MCX4486402.1 hypothetical protein [Streptomyces anulatus]MCX4523381.1 hypothetical protein [Streptomyces anulatus]MCX4606391.1 hypothetical protein [Streptomyces anulatus]WSI82444.1 hypothetical protein OG557_38430 [Streptomyces anulatus]
MGQLIAVDRGDGTGCYYAIDTATRRPVGEVIPSDVYPGNYRAGVHHPTRGVVWVKVSGSSETLVDLTQVGTENFTTVQAALAAISRNRPR